VRARCAGPCGPARLVDLFERADAFRRPDRFAELLKACECDAAAWVKLTRSDCAPAPGAGGCTGGRWRCGRPGAPERCRRGDSRGPRGGGRDRARRAGLTPRRALESQRFRPRSCASHEVRRCRARARPSLNLLAGVRLAAFVRVGPLDYRVSPPTSRCCSRSAPWSPWPAASRAAASRAASTEIPLVLLVCVVVAAILGRREPLAIVWQRCRRSHSSTMTVDPKLQDEPVSERRSVAKPYNLPTRRNRGTSNKLSAFEF